MIPSAQEFQRLRTSDKPAEYERAANEEAPLEVWNEIITTMPDMREWVAHNKTVPLEILALLARDESSRVRHVVATKRKLTADLQLALAHDMDASVRHALACNAKAAKAVLEILARDAETFVRTRAAERLQKGDHA